MLKQSFNENWRVCRVGGEKNAKPVDLPHDAMLSEPRNAGSAGGTNTGWFEAHDYVYERQRQCDRVKRVLRSYDL